MPHDWTQPPLSETPGDLGPALAGARLVAVENDRAARTILLRFALPPDAGTTEATFRVEAATHLLAFGYLPPTVPLEAGLSPEETMASVGEWSRQGVIATVDPLAYGTPLVVARATLHATEGAMTLTVEGYGEDADVLVWWEVRAAGASVEANSDGENVAQGEAWVPET